MDLQAIVDEYPLRILHTLFIKHTSLDFVFDLPNEHSLNLTIAIFPGTSEETLTMSVSVQEFGEFRLQRSESSQFVLVGDETDVPVYLQRYLLLCVGDPDVHTYAYSMINHLLEQLKKG